VVARRAGVALSLLSLSLGRVPGAIALSRAVLRWLRDRYFEQQEAEKPILSRPRPRR
jgi:hypothetical protein